VDQGISVIVISSDLEELLAMSDRVLVMANGSIKGEFLAREATFDKIMALAVHRNKRSDRGEKLARCTEGQTRSGRAGGFVLLCVFFSLVTNTFLTVPNILNILRQVSISGLIVMFMTMIIISTDIDLSVGSIFAAVGMIVAILFQNGMIIWLASLVGLLAGAGFGLINGVVTVKGALPPFIVTLGTQMIYRVLPWSSPAVPRLRPPAGCVLQRHRRPHLPQPARTGPLVFGRNLHRRLHPS